MPLYEYYCPKCRNEFELLLFGQQQAICPDCGSKKLEKWFSVPGSPVDSSIPSCPGQSDSCRSQPMSCCGNRGCALQ
ncbi:MAG: FmdB family zinc ribbon protein [Thermoguttaceae bacterium]